jgi:predicted dienelactone hydrolase
MKLTDTSRMNPWAPKPEHRSVMVTAYYPVGERCHCDWDEVKYMPDKTAAIISKQLKAEFGIPVPLGSARLQMCALKRSEMYHPKFSDFGKNEFPVVLFSPGYGASRLFHGAQAQAIASLGTRLLRW